MDNIISVVSSGRLDKNKIWLGTSGAGWADATGAGKMLSGSKEK